MAIYRKRSILPRQKVATLLPTKFYFFGNRYMDYDKVRDVSTKRLTNGFEIKDLYRQRQILASILDEMAPTSTAET